MRRKPPEEIPVDSFRYDLPEECIAKYPLLQRDQSQLLLSHNGILSKHFFHEIPALLPSDSLLIFNNTRVIRARMQFQKPTGAAIEVFFLHPVQQEMADYETTFQSSSPVVWEAIIGNAKKWKHGILSRVLKIQNKDVTLWVKKIEQHSASCTIKLTWDDPSLTLSEIFLHSGKVPLPPYIKREAEPVDNERYQTVYADIHGSVAAPTAGLHFTDEVFEAMKDYGISYDFTTLHVGAGTFRPISGNSFIDHTMHAETFSVSRNLIEKILNHQGPVISVGTTTARTLESIVTLAARLTENGDLDANHIVVTQWEAYNYNFSIKEGKKRLKQLLKWMESKNLSKIEGSTQLMITPGYTFRIVQGLITNFHQPGSTLLLLVAALIGDDWKKAYQFALQHNFRFLSYGDSCLFLP